MSLHGWLNIKSLIGLCLLSICSLASAAIQLQQTRMVYPEGEPSVALVIKNNDATHSVAIESWVKSDQGALIIKPSATIIKPAAKGVINIHIHDNGKNNEESLYWLSIKGVPLEKSTSSKPVAITVINRIKVFYRPQSLIAGAADAYKQISVSRCAKQITIKNPTPYYVTFYSFKIDNQEVTRAQMIAPYGELLMPQPTAGQKNRASWQSIADSGFRTPSRLKKITTGC
ncbi:putative fimbrial chaperone protein [Pseudescherichia vulneris NBRC 102420]|uniref:Putative fimbrial chaperone protein n=1 Tax=Pseudescherichia vulneris NBRC 102420 TaxID=1115515 RepID=A0A090V350_PSEVU|nr:molecular chaperone [Pseudescherichia vulneris]GAL58488.1 putative fimbrial chaperone protein [Pseudescherichia vulneris NBRC 102420]STQ60567.1 type I fimbrial chaperone [Pseudescherichia vulneris]